MNFNQYQQEARKTAIYPNKDNNITYPTLGLSGESGEVAEKVKKILRDKNGIVSDEDRLELQKELGDVLWYVANLSSELKLSMEDVALINIQKLQSRQKRKVLKGSGDNR